MTEGEPRGALRLLVDPVVGPFTFGKLLSVCGNWMHAVVAAILAYQLTGSAFVVGLVSVVQFLPQLLFAPLSGAFADRGNKRRQLLFGRSIAGAGSAALAVWVGIVGVPGLPGVWPILLSSAVTGVGFVIGGPAMQAMLPAMVRPDEIAAAVQLDNVPPSLARAVGPAVGASLAAAVGPAAAFGVAAATNVVFLLVILRINVAAPMPLERKEVSVRAGLRYVWSDPPIALLLLGVAAVALGADPAITFAPSLADELGRGDGFVGVLGSAFGIGSLATYGLLRTARSVLGAARVGVAGLLLTSVTLLAVAASSSAIAMVGAFVVAGAGMTLALTSFSTELQSRIPDEMRGRVMGLWFMAFVGSRPIASSVNGLVADWLSVDFALVAVASGVAFCAYLCRPGRVPAVVTAW